MASPPHDTGRSLDVVRIAVALIVAAHPIYTLAHPELWASIPLPLPWLWLAVMAACALALLVPRLRVPAAIGTMIGLAVGIALFYPPPYWYVAGGAAVDGHPGSELNVLFIVLLAGIAVGGKRGLDVVRIGAALLLIAHPLHGFLAWDVEGMRQWGHAMEGRGFPLGVPLVWGVITLQTLCSVALVANRFVVLACLGHIAVLANGIALVHWPAWFMVGPGENGIEMPLTYIVCFASLVLAYAPRKVPAVAVAQSS